MRGHVHLIFNLTIITMIGFEVMINDTHLMSVAAESSRLFISNIQDTFILMPGGIDDQDNSLRWPHHVLKVGDKINIKVKDLEVINEPNEIVQNDTENIRERYNRLKNRIGK